MQKIPAKLSRVALVLELDIDIQRPAQWVRFTTSIPGRLGTFSRVWELSEGHLNSEKFDDLSAWLQKSLLDAVEMIGGIQDTLL